MTITDISKKLEIYRKTAAKYLDMLLITGQVEMRPFGPVKIYTTSRRLPLSSLLDLSSYRIMILDRDLKVVQMNEGFRELLPGDAEEVTGLPVHEIELPFGMDTELTDHLTEAVGGIEHSKEIIADMGDGERTFDLKCVPVTFDGGEQGVALRLKELSEHMKMENLVRIRDDMLKALGFMTERIRDPHHLESILPQVLERMGKAGDLSRTYICMNSRNDDGALAMKRIHEWSAAGVREGTEGDQPGETVYSDFGERLEDTLSRGRIYFGHIRDFLPGERTVFETQGVRSVAIAPIFVGGEWWGYLGLDLCDREWEWTSSEMEGIRTAAGILGSILERHGTEEILR